MYSVISESHTKAIISFWMNLFSVEKISFSFKPTYICAGTLIPKITFSFVGVQKFLVSFNWQVVTLQ